MSNVGFRSRLFFVLGIFVCVASWAESGWANPRTLVVTWGHSNCREGHVPVQKPVPANAFLYFPIVGVMPMPAAPSLGGLSTAIAERVGLLNGTFYFLNACLASTSFQDLHAYTQNPDFSSTYALRPLILQAVSTAALQLNIQRIVFLYLEPTGDAVYFATSSLGNLAHLSAAYQDLAEASHQAAKLAGATQISHAVVMMDGTYAPASPMALTQPMVIAQQQQFVANFGATPISAQGATFPDGTHYESSYMFTLAQSIYDQVLSKP